MRAGSIALSLAVISSAMFAACGGDLLLPAAGAPATVRLVSGDLQEGETGQRLPQPLVVAVGDRGGRPVAGSPIVFRFERASDGGRVTPDTIETNAEGRATATVRLGQDPGAHPVEAVVVDATDLRVRFILTAFAPEPTPPTGGGGGGGDGNGGNGGGGSAGGDDGGGGDGGGAVDGGGGDGHDDGGGHGGKDKGKGKGGKGRGGD